MSLESLREKRRDIAAQMEDIMSATDETGLTDDQAQQFDDLEAKFQQVDKQVERAEKSDQINARLQEREPTRAGAQQLTSSGYPQGPEASREFEDFGEFMHAVRFRPSDQRLEFNDPELRGEQRFDTGSTGGFAVPPRFVDELLRVDPAPALVRPRANVIPAGTPADQTVTMPALDTSGDNNLYGGVEVDWIGEGDTKPETTANLHEVSLSPYEVAGHIVVTDKLLRNWQAAGAILGDLLRGAITQAEDTAFIAGTGIGQPEGYINADAAITVNREVANEVSYEDIIEMEANMLTGAEPVAVVTRRVVKQLRQIQNPNGQFIWGDGNIAMGIPPTLLGYPVVISDRGRSLGDAGDVAFVDLSYYLIKDGSGPFVAASEHVHFRQNKTVIKVSWNVDGKAWMVGPVTKENGETQSPFVLLGDVE